MGARVHAFDWSATPVGPIGGWPPHLCAQASLVLAAPFAHVLLWGPELTVVAYNDAYKAFLGSKPEALGRPILDVWAEVREALAPQFEKVLAGETVHMRDARFTLLRGSGPEEAWFDYGFSPVYDEAGRVVGMLHSGVETTARVQAEARLRESEARWRGLFENMHEGFAHCEIVYGPDGRAEDYRHLEVNDAALRLTGLSRGELLGRRAGEAMPGLERMWTDAFARVVETGEPAHIEHQAAPLGRWFEVIAYRTEPGRFGSLFLDITGRKAAEERQTLLSREVDHRAKNALAVVQAALRLTSAPDLPGYVRAIEGRVAALARAQTLLADDRWAGADLHTLLRGELAAFVEGDTPRVELRGPPVALPAGAAQPFAMAVHELATNAVKYGALSTPPGRVTVRWDLDGAPDATLRLRWSETGGPPVRGEPSRSGFGTRLLKGTVGHQLGGVVSKSWQASGLVCDIVLPLGRARTAAEWPAGHAALER
jgi:PAS domain S-box-containing protein